MLLRCHWDLQTQVSALTAGELHLWCIELNYSEIIIADLHHTLNDDERARAARFRFARDRNRFIIARAFLRNRLSSYLNVPANALQFTYNPHGKPTLLQHPHLQFNLSHSNEFALLGVAHQYAIGVDIEYQKEIDNIDALATRFFSPNEAQQLKNLSGAEKQLAFFNGWARKEAFLKALGEGLSFSLANVEVSLTETPKIIALHDANLHSADWSMHTLQPVDDYAAAVVIKDAQRIQTLRTWQFTFS